MKKDKFSEPNNECNRHLDNNLMLQIIQRVMEDHPLGDLDVDDFRRFFFNLMWDYKRSEKEVQSAIKRFNQAIPNFLKQISETMEEIGKSHKRILKLMDEERAFRASLPEGVSDQDHPEVIALARKLTETYYTLTAAEKLVSTSRQTLQLHAKNHQYGLRLHFPDGRSPKLFRHDLINYYRERFHKDYNFLVTLVENINQKSKD